MREMHDNVDTGERRRYEDKLEVILNSIQSEIRELRCDVSKNELETNDIRTEIRGLVAAWNTASNVATFMKWLAAVGMAGIFLYSALSGKLPIM